MLYQHLCLIPYGQAVKVDLSHSLLSGNSPEVSDDGVCIRQKSNGRNAPQQEDFRHRIGDFGVDLLKVEGHELHLLSLSRL